MSLSSFLKIPFITTWRTQYAGESIFLSTNDTLYYEFFVDWGDGTGIEYFSGLGPDVEHGYLASGTYTVQVFGIFPHFISEPGSPSADKLISVEQWGQYIVAEYVLFFQRCR